MTPRIPTRLLLAGSLAVAPGPALALSIGADAFGPGARVESFEGVTTLDLNVGQSPWPGVMEPGLGADHTFASGVRLRGPNPGADANGAFVHDLRVRGAVNNWRSHGRIDDPGDVPFGSAYLGAFDSVGRPGDPVPVELIFGADMLRVGAFVAGGVDRGRPLTVTLDAYDANGNRLESRTVETVHQRDWGSSFLGIERSEGIRRVVFSGADFGLDGLTFEQASSTPVPEPGTHLLLALGLAGLALIGRPRALATRSA